ncbi:uncharacterized protein [Watersipora subatra]|uniref:uncharacterized protein n=1 Tax=Watersipora subatra TaxID=2589382 RepID=UPI00355C6007
MMRSTLVSYQPPSWAQNLQNIPTSIVRLAMTPTPIQEWKLPSTPSDFKVYIKRDDLTGSVLTGNKVRKLEFILGEAIKSSCKHVITTGSWNSNHCRATAVASVEVGLRPHLLIRVKNQDISDRAHEGNMFLNKLVGAEIYPITPGEVDAQQQMSELAAEIQAKTGEKSHLVPLGGSDMIGLWGYLQCFEEIRQQGVEFDDLLCVCGSSGTFCGLAIANYLCGSPYRVHGVRVVDRGNVQQKLKDKMEGLGVSAIDWELHANLYDEYMGPGYGISTPPQLDYTAKVAAATGIILDTTYTGKAAYGMYELMNNRPEVFKGRRILFLHSGGSIGLYNQSVIDKLLPFVPGSRQPNATSI